MSATAVGLIKWHNSCLLTQTFKKGWMFGSSDRPGKLNYIIMLCESFSLRFLTKSNQKAILNWLSKYINNINRE